MGVRVLPVIVIVIVIRAKGANYGVLLEMDCQVHESYALVLQLRRLHLSCALDLVEKFNWEGKRKKKKYFLFY